MRRVLTTLFNFRQIKERLVIVFFVCTAVISGCKKFLNTPPPVTTLSSVNVYTTNATAAAVLTGIYTTMIQESPTMGDAINAVPLITGLSSDELTLFGGVSNANTILVQFYENNLSPGQSNSNPTLWAHIYAKIYICNIAIEELQNSVALTPAVKQELIGEAKFLRAYFYFYLVNLYGNVPLAISSDVSLNANLSRSPQIQVYQQIIADLVSAQSLLSNGYVAADAQTSTTERVRPNKWAATALLARAYLYFGNLTGDAGDFTNAINQSSAVINNSSEYSLTALNSVFFKNSGEAIWQLQPVNTGWNTPDAQVFILPNTGPTSNTNPNGYPVYLSAQFLNAFETGDQRKVNWVGSVTVNNTTYYYPYKYKSATLNAPVTEYTMVLRLGEQYLVRAEAEAYNNEISASLADLNTIRNRAGLTDYAGATDKTSLLAAILHERQVEFFTEGHRWLDLKRTGNANTVMAIAAPLKGATWNADWQLYPVPLFDISNDSKLVQNPGY